MIMIPRQPSADSDWSEATPSSSDRANRMRMEERDRLFQLLYGEGGNTTSTSRYIHHEDSQEDHAVEEGRSRVVNRVEDVMNTAGTVLAGTAETAAHVTTTVAKNAVLITGRTIKGALKGLFSNN